MWRAPNFSPSMEIWVDGSHLDAWLRTAAARKVAEMDMSLLRGSFVYGFVDGCWSDFMFAIERDFGCQDQLNDYEVTNFTSAINVYCSSLNEYFTTKKNQEQPQLFGEEIHAVVSKVPGLMRLEIFKMVEKFLFLRSNSYEEIFLSIKWNGDLEPD
ncbi:hypothetical protein CFP56_025612 [Quercus suber]|uniref:NR LBD domain-containing protein n=1 Tax=Quercus suber TaxID=58331 RepID=A0AAW0K4I1_QUESU